MSPHLASLTARRTDLAATRAGQRAHRLLTSGDPVPTGLRLTAAALLFLAFMMQVVGLSVSDTINGLALGALYGVVGVALVLIYLTTRIINFAAAAIGAVPAIGASILVTNHGVNYALALPIAAVGGLVFGALSDAWVIRRFARAPRLIVTVVTIGLAQSFSALGFFLPVWLGAHGSTIPKVPTPWGNVALHNGRGQPVLTGDQVFAFVIVIALATGLGLFLKFSRFGIALRAAAENADRAALLGIPVNTVSTIAWSLSGLLAGLAIYAQTPLIGVPREGSLGFDTLLYALTAAVLARMKRIGATLVAGMGIGMIIYASVSKLGNNDYASGIMVVLVLGGLLLQRGGSRALDTGVSTWQSVKSFRPIPTELRMVPEVLRARAGLVAVGVALTIGLPYLVGPLRLPSLELLPLWGIVAVSLVVLTGWAGQISLGQFGLVGIGAGVAGGLVANHNIDFFVALGIGVAAGALTAVIIGLPAVRIQGLQLAVTTLAFGYALEFYVLNPNFALGRHLLPSGYTAHLLRPVLYGRFDLENERTFYFVEVVLLLLVIAAALAFRRNHSGRVLIAMRDNPRAMASYAVNPIRTKLAAFAVSGGMAGLAGVLFAYQQHNVLPDSYSVYDSIAVFLAASVAGLTSVWAATLGVMAFEAIVLFGPLLWQHIGLTATEQSVIPLLLTGPLLVLNLYFNPGGLAEAVFGARDRFLRRVAQRHRIHVPALVADSRVLERAVAPPDPVLAAAGAQREEVRSS